MDGFQSPVSTLIHSNVRCLVGIYGPHKDDILDEAFSAVLDVEPSDDPEMFRRALNVDDSDRIQFLVGSQSLKQNENQVTLVTLIEADEHHPSSIVKQSFAHPDGEVVGLTTLAAQPSWFISVYSSCSSAQGGSQSGARVWRLPTDLTPPDSTFGANQDSKRPELSIVPPMEPTNLEYVTSLPLGKYSSVKKVVSHPSTNCADLACLVSPPTNSSNSAGKFSSTNTFLVMLQAPTESGSSGEYLELASSPICFPPTAQIFHSHLKANPNHLLKAANSAGLIPVASPSHAIRWSPFQQAGHLAVAFESGVLGWDVRSMKPSFWLESAHWPCVRDLDFNPNRPTVLATGGDDGCVRLWDLRYLKSKPADRVEVNKSKTQATLFGSSEQCTEPLFSVQAHSHWVWSVRYHPSRDQLLLSSGSDCRVCLLNLSTFSSDAIELSSPSDVDEENEVHSTVSSTYESKSNASETATSIRMKDGLIGRMELHEESVYTAEWNPVDPWYFASVSYDGNLLINQVPEAVKFGILLEKSDT